MRRRGGRKWRGSAAPWRRARWSGCGRCGDGDCPPTPGQPQVRRPRRPALASEPPRRVRPTDKAPAPGLPRHRSRASPEETSSATRGSPKLGSCSPRPTTVTDVSASRASLASTSRRSAGWTSTTATPVAGAEDRQITQELNCISEALLGEDQQAAPVERLAPPRRCRKAAPLHLGGVKPRFVAGETRGEVPLESSSAE